MELFIELLPFIFMMLITGIVGGILAGLLGVGGGIVIVPVLDIALGWYNVDSSIRMHIAIATSLACIIFTSISSTRAHHSRGAVDFKLLKNWGPTIVVGALFGTIIASNIDSQVLSAIFAVIALLVAIKMVLPLDGIIICKDIPQGMVGKVPPLMIGSLSAMIGIGGGTLSVPVLTLMSQPIHRAVGTAALFGLLISLPATIGFVVSGLGDPRLPPGSVGYVNVIAVALISSVTVWTAPIGAKLAHKLTKRQLSMLFGSFLFIVGCRMFYRALTF